MHPRPRGNQGGYGGGNQGGYGGGNRGGNQGGYGGGNRGGYAGGNQGGPRHGGGNQGGFGGGNQGGFGGGNRGGPRGGGARAPPTYQMVGIPTASTLTIAECANPKTSSVNQNVLINSYEVELPKRNVTRYDLKFYAVHGKLEDPKTDDLSVWPEKSMVAARRNCITKLYDLLYQQNPDLFGKNDKEAPHIYAYDRIGVFFSSFPMEVRDETNPIYLDVTELNAEVFGTLRKPREVYAVLKAPRYLDFEKGYDSEQMQMYLDILFCQYQHDSIEEFVKFGSNMFCLQSTYDIGYSGELKDGHSQSTRCDNLEKGDTGKLIIDGKLSPFYTALPLLHFLNGMFGYTEATNFLSDDIRTEMAQLKGVYVRTTHKESNEIFKISGFSTQSAQNTMFDFNGEPISVVDYFLQKYQKIIEYPKFPLVIKRSGNQDTFYPMEFLRVQQGQKIRREKLNGQQEAQMIKLAQRKPLNLMDHIAAQRKQAHIVNADAYVKAARVKIHDEMDEVSAPILPAPLITYQDGGRHIEFAEWDIRNDKFVKPAVIGTFIIFLNRVTRNEATPFINDLVNRARRFGTSIDNYDFHELQPGEVNIPGLVAQVEYYRDNFGCKYAMFLGDSKGFHDMIKATEVQTGVTTQQVMPKTVNKAGGATATNIIQKMNPKNGGFNHFFQQNADHLAQLPDGRKFDLFKTYMKGTLVMGIFLSHAPPGFTDDELKEIPTVGGYAYNIQDEGNVARGGFFYMKSCEDEPNPDGKIVRRVSIEQEYRYPIKQAFKHYHEKNGKYPDRVLLYRFGASDGEFQKVQTAEAMAIHAEMIDITGSDHTKLTIVGVRRQHNNRLFKQAKDINQNDGAPQQNVKPGTCAKGYNPSEVVMVPHRALQGTAKPTVFTMMYNNDEPQVSEDVFTNVTHALCYMHEIVSSAISVPAHLRNAEQMANRGRKLWLSKNSELPHSEDMSSVFESASKSFNPPMETRYWA